MSGPTVGEMRKGVVADGYRTSPRDIAECSLLDPETSTPGEEFAAKEVSRTSQIN